MNSYDMFKDINFNPKEYDPHTWFIEQDSFELCAFDDEAIDIPVFIMSEYQLAHYKYAINICCETNLDDFYDCLGTQPLKIVFSHLIDDNFVRRHGFDIYPDTELPRTYKIDKNNLYLDTNEIIMESSNGVNVNITKDNYKDFDLSDSDIKKIEDDMESLYSDDDITSDEEDLSDQSEDDDNEEEAEQETGQAVEEEEDVEVEEEQSEDDLLDDSELDIDLEEVKIN